MDAFFNCQVLRKEIKKHLKELNNIDRNFVFVFLNIRYLLKQYIYNTGALYEIFCSGLPVFKIIIKKPLHERFLIENKKSKQKQVRCGLHHSKDLFSSNSTEKSAVKTQESIPSSNNSSNYLTCLTQNDKGHTRKRKFEDENDELLNSYSDDENGFRNKRIRLEEWEKENLKALDRLSALAHRRFTKRNRFSQKSTQSASLDEKKKNKSNIHQPYK